MTNIPNINIEGARILFRNFSGNESQFNPQGRRNFCVLLDPEQTDQFLKDGWNVKFLAPRDDLDPPQPYMQVAVNFDGPRPPVIYMLTSRGKTRLDASTCSLLDFAEIENVDLIITPYPWEVGNKRGIKAYLKTLYVKIAEDELEKKYSGVADTRDVVDNYDGWGDPT